MVDENQQEVRKKRSSNFEKIICCLQFLADFLRQVLDAWFLSKTFFQKRPSTFRLLSIETILEEVQQIVLEESTNIENDKQHIFLSRVWV